MQGWGVSYGLGLWGAPFPENFFLNFHVKMQALCILIAKKTTVARNRDRGRGINIPPPAADDVNARGLKI